MMTKMILIKMITTALMLHSVYINMKKKLLNTLIPYFTVHKHAIFLYQITNVEKI